MDIALLIILAAAFYGTVIYLAEKYIFGQCDRPAAERPNSRAKTVCRRGKAISPRGTRNHKWGRIWH